MAIANPELISALEKTIFKLSNGSPYQWGHMGACNCGNLAQELTKLEKSEIHRYAMGRYGDWNQQLVDFCPTSGYPMDLMISKMLEFGLTIEDLSHLERLSDPKILSAMPFERRRSISKNSKEDVIYYMKTWSELLRKAWVKENVESEIAIEEKKLAVALL
ncbi:MULTISPECIES: hypothetical protein [Algoriphagus]|jgi:hypothetical protein|uniref:hypothetical protein n=1 Tax=Algoriphagus TaxID=246875 RepID=UPI00094B7C5F|nr:MULTISPECIES: hypothetical protein [Algoriphagus]MDG1279628.1 hypothetical protein [Algoriphagus sp.]